MRPDAERADPGAAPETASPPVRSGFVGHAILALGLLGGAWLRVRGVGEAAPFGDEFHTLDLARQSVGTIVTTFDDVGSHVVLPLLQHVSLAILGDGAFALRMPALIPGLLTLLLLFPVARGMVGRTPAILATLLFAISPMHVYYSRFGRSYALIVLLELLLVHWVVRATRPNAAGGAHSRRAWIGVACVAAALPYTHLSSAGFVAALALVACWLVWRERGVRALAAPLAAFGSAALVCGLLFLPLLPQIDAYFATTEGVKEHPLTWFGIPLLLAGGAAEGWVWLVGFPAALIWIARKRVDVALVGAASLLGPLATLLAKMPHGMEYAYARYLMGALPFAAMALAAGFVALAQRYTRESVVCGIGALLIGASLVTGPLVGVPRTGEFDNTYLAMRSLPAFDRAWPGAPAIYDEIAALEGDVHVVESPPITSRGVLLYRGHALRHGKRVSLGYPEADPLHQALYVNLSTVTKADADYVIVHRNLAREVRAYWRFVYDEVWPTMPHGSDEGFMERHRAHFIAGQPAASEEVAASLAAIVREHLGPATYKDKHVLVWKLE